MAPTSPGMTDEQVEELLNALLDFRQMLLGLTDRFQSRLALLEQEFSERRTAPPRKTGPLALQGAAVATRLQPQAPLAAPEPDPLEAFDILDDEEAFEPDDGEAFSILEIDEDEDDF